MFLRWLGRRERKQAKCSDPEAHEPGTGSKRRNEQALGNLGWLGSRVELLSAASLVVGCVQKLRALSVGSGRDLPCVCMQRIPFKRGST